eukprot:SAG31_NODE_41768_length_274_cov_1.160000_2_plen_22_part_01
MAAVRYKDDILVAFASYDPDNT